jgi:hypothetical protein
MIYMTAIIRPILCDVYAEHFSSSFTPKASDHLKQWQTFLFAGPDGQWKAYKLHKEWTNYTSIVQIDKRLGSNALRHIIIAFICKIFPTLDAHEILSTSQRHRRSKRTGPSELGKDSIVNDKLIECSRAWQLFLGLYNKSDWPSHWTKLPYNIDALLPHEQVDG